MRRYGWWVAATAVAATLGGSVALAEMDVNGPADVPPPSFKGRQYVDSVGCVFVRAGYGGTVTWVPRVDRTKKQLCGYQPSLPQGAPVAEVVTAPAKAAPPVAVAAAPAPAPAPAPAVRPAGSAFAPTPFVGKPMETIATTETPPRIGLGAAARPPLPAAPVRVAAVPPAPISPPVATAAPLRSGYVSPYALDGGFEAAGTPVAAISAATPGRGSVRYHNTLPVPVRITGTETVAAAATACPAGMATAQRYLLSDGRSVVRCGGATENPVDFINAAAVPGLVVAASAPMSGGSGYAAALAPPSPGTGTPQQAYAAASPYALGGGVAPMTARPGSSGTSVGPVMLRAPSGHSTLAPITVETSVGPTGYAPAFDDGRLNPFRGPRTAMGDAEQGVMWTNQVPSRRVTERTPQRRRIVPAEPAYVTAPTYHAPAYAAPDAVAPLRVSSKSAPEAAAPAAPRYVQVGSFAVAGNAAAAKARLAAAGLPVSSARTGRGLTVVLAGPFADARQALATVRNAGFAEGLLR
ncbi:SPOR domain-containing protein [Rhodobacter capsulatus]|uniref:SPOR domain-containing protein n=1 Tax=Rhodobacter capsulatus TaxID=1061 RepID=UPI0003D38CBA|nr:SPOR domain-containing protein [Rhodobacter capsulatus]ETD03059.1 hypothetical protein U714_03100 [Rhodobacter capsulatus DE442]ETD79701.1 hypothetical protein U717_03110 [Rhodobacter capsulatus R121]ETE55118.1 hypothetical protein U715_03100 [Rhodobacter capsulatus Y262]MDS0925897.1 SPOR domain-containing protein [Rhodobacter capsulatus]